MGAAEDPELVQETLNFITTKSKDQDIFYFFMGVGANFKGRRPLTKYFQEQYDVVSNLTLVGNTCY